MIPRRDGGADVPDWAASRWWCCSAAEALYLDMPNARTSVPDERAARIIVSASLSVLGIPAFVVFAAAFRGVLLEVSRPDVLPTAAFVERARDGVRLAETITWPPRCWLRDDELGRSLGQALSRSRRSSTPQPRDQWAFLPGGAAATRAAARSWRAGRRWC